MDAQQKAEKMERHLLKTQFPIECEELPFDDLTPEEQIVVIKCKNHDDLTDDEFSLLKKTLVRYREGITKYRPSETVEAFERTENMILTEKEWLDIVDNQFQKNLRVNVPFNEQWYPMEFEILPLDDSRVVETLQTHVDLFKDYSIEMSKNESIYILHFDFNSKIIYYGNIIFTHLIRIAFIRGVQIFFER